MTRKQIYNDYLKSAAWRRVRKIVFKRDDYKCQRCKCKASEGNWLECHHTTYENLGFEVLEDLLTLCRKCHVDHHRSEKSRLKKVRKKKREKKKRVRKQKVLKETPKKPSLNIRVTEISGVFTATSKNNLLLATKDKSPQGAIIKLQELIKQDAKLQAEKKRKNK